MSKDERLTFSEFFLIEFCNKIIEIAETKLSENHFLTIKSVISYLKTEDNFEEGIELLAREHSTSELSIFLFDIMDRITDYPPTLVFDSIYEMADDFVNTLNIMLEEEETIDTLNEINDKLAKEVEKIPEEIPEETFREEISTEELQDENIDFNEFLRKEFFENLKEKLTEKSDENNVEHLLKFTEIVLQDSDHISDESTPQELQNLIFDLQGLIPVKSSDEINIIEHRKNIIQGLPEIINLLFQIDKNYSEIVDSTITENQIVIPEQIRADTDESVIEEKPTTIDDLLTEYFQSEIDEYLKIFKNGFDNLKNDQKNITSIEFLEKKFHSFKEICMIHGYDVIESFCARMLQLLSDLRINKYDLSDDFFKINHEIIEQFHESDKYKGKDINSEEGQKINTLLDGLEKTIDKTKVVSEKDIDEKQISFDDKESMLLIFKDLINDMQPFLDKELLEKNNLKSAKNHFYKILHASELYGYNSITDFCNEYAKRLDILGTLENSQYQEYAEELSSILQKVVEKISTEFDENDWKVEISKFDDKIKPVYSINDTSTLLKILVELEEEMVVGFNEKLKKIVNENDVETKFNLKQHFQKFQRNAELIGANNLRNFTEFYVHLFDSTDEFDYSDEVLEEITHSYKLTLQRIKENGDHANIDEIVSVLNEVITEYSDREAKEELTTEDEPGEEELEQIFKDEAKTYIWKINDALTLLEDGPSNKDAFKEIEKNAHSLKSSARLMGFDDIANICSKIENIVEIYYSNEESPDADDLKSLKNTVSGLKYFIDGENITISDFEAELLIIENKLKDKSKEKPKPELADTKFEPKSDEKALFVADEDEEMLDIFKEESSAFIDVIEKAVAALKKGDAKSEEIHQFEYASHSLKSAAKMLGFREIGQISDGIEQIAESINKNEIIYTEHLHKILSLSIATIKSISEGNKFSSSEITDLLNQLNVQKLVERQSEDADLSELKSDVKDEEELDPMVDLFLKEAWELLEKINHDLVNLEKKHDIELIKVLSRNIHTLKGSAQMMQFEKISQISHAIEDFFEKQLESDETVSERDLSHIFHAIDSIQEMLKSIKNGEGEKGGNFKQVLESLGVKVAEDLETAVKTDQSDISVEKDRPEKSTSYLDESKQLIKISTDRLDNLINMAAELVINKTQLINYLDSLKKLGIDLDKDRHLLKNADYSLDEIILKRKNFDGRADESVEIVGQSGDQFSNLALVSKDFKHTLDTIDFISSQFNTLTQSFENKINRISNLIKMLHDDILQVRMLPVENLFDRFPRIVRDLSHEQNKKIDLVIEGEKTEMDRAMIESLTDPLMHLVRNAIDHGIELPEERKQNEKVEVGTILLKAHQDKNQIIIEVKDDGRGIDVEVVKNKILEKKLVAKDKLENMSSSDILDFIFSPGFSTKEKTSSVSGRGIGLDVVTDQVKKLKGDIRVNSNLGKGTVFSIRVPLTLIISQALLFKMADQILAIPLISIEESIQFNIKSVTLKGSEKYISIRDESLPVIDLNDLLNYSEPKKEGEVQALIIQETGIRCALIIDEVIGREEIVIKSLGAHLQNLEYISGGTILGDGTIALIIDTSAIIRKVEKDFKEIERDMSSIPGAKKKIETKKETEVKPEKEPDKEKSTGETKKISDRKPAALIVDDSISVRRFVASVLEKNNYTTVLASDGVSALECLEKSDFDIVVTDLEMPKMHGFELIEKIREQEKYKDLPIVILTGRAGKKHRDMGDDLGANAFIVKPFKETDLLKILRKFIVN